MNNKQPSRIGNSVTAILLFVACIAHGQEPISTDRPDQSTTPQLVPAGALQVESGYSRSILRETEIREVTADASSLCKYGLTKNVELRFGTSYLLMSAKQPESLERMILNPVSVGSKIRLARKKGSTPQISLVTTLSIEDTGTSYARKNPSAEIIVACAHDLTERASLTYNAIFLFADKSAFEAGYTIVCGYSVTKSFGLFLESYGSLHTKSHSGHFVDGGITVKLSPTLQLDGSGGMSFQRPAMFYFFSTGFSVRFLK